MVDVVDGFIRHVDGSCNPRTAFNCKPLQKGGDENKKRTISSSHLYLSSLARIMRISVSRRWTSVSAAPSASVLVPEQKKKAAKLDKKSRPSPEVNR